MVDTLGGIEIDSDKAFTAWTDRECHITKGKQHLNGKCALALARERYSYDSGDRHRGENQQAVIQAMINKFTAKKVIGNYESILNGVQGMFQTNMTTDEITALIQMQINDMAKWDVSTTLVDGAGDMVPTYSYGSTPLYVMRPNQSTIEEANKLIQETMK